MLISLALVKRYKFLYNAVSFSLLAEVEAEEEIAQSMKWWEKEKEKKSY